MAKKKVLSLEEKLEEALIPKEEQLYELPDNWEWVKLGEITKFINGDRGKNYPSKKMYVDQGIPFLSAGNIKNNKLDILNLNYISEERYDLLGSGKVKKNDILYCLRGSLGKVAPILELDKGAVASSLVIIRPRSTVKPNFLYNYFLGDLAERMIEKYENGTAQPNLSAKNVGEYSFPLPPKSEQERIVKKLEDMLSKVEQAKELISEARETFELRRASILHQAFTGELTKKWREGNLVESGKLSVDSLLEKINVEKMAKWEEESKKAVEEGKRKPKKPVIKPVEEMKVPLEEQPYELPDGWGWVRLGEIVEIIMGQSPKGIDVSQEKIGLGLIGGPSDMGDKLPKIRRYAKNSNKVSKIDDLIVSIRATLGKTIFSDNTYCLGRGVAAVRSKTLPKEILKYYFEKNTEYLYKIGTGSTFKQVSSKDLYNLAFPISPLNEQKEIVKKLEEILETEEKAKELLAIENQIELLKKSILSKAFRGELGTNDPNDEPAMELLRRVLGDEVTSQVTKKIKIKNTERRETKVKKEKTILEIIEENKKIEINELIKISTKSILEVQKELQTLSKEGKIKISKKDYKTLLEVQSENN